MSEIRRNLSFEVAIARQNGDEWPDLESVRTTMRPLEIVLKIAVAADGRLVPGAPRVTGPRLRQDGTPGAVMSRRAEGEWLEPYVRQAVREVADRGWPEVYAGAAV